MIKLNHIFARFKNRPDSEHQQAFVRLAICFLIGVYLVPTAISQHNTAYIWGAGIALSIISAIPVWIYFRPGKSAVRRVFGILCDTTALTVSMILNGEHWMVFYVLFIWTTSGYGFRFGSKYLQVSLVSATIGLSIASYFSQGLTIPSEVLVELIIAYVCFCFYVNSLVKRLYIALENANLASDAKRQFLSTMSHEIRTPLHAIAGLAELLRGMVSKPQEKELTILIDSSVDQVLHLVNAVLDFSKIEAGKIEVENQSFNVDKLIASLSHLYIQQSREKRIAFKTRIALSVPEWIEGDQFRIQQVLTNLISNAFKFTPKGSVSLIVDVEQSKDGNDFIKWTVRDSGIGIAPEAQAKIFESFTQADASTSRTYGGTGLGTTIAQELVILMGGEIGLVSEMGKGSEFWFTIPFKKQVKENPAQINFTNNPLLVLSVNDKHSELIKAQCSTVNMPLIYSRSAINQELSKSNSQTIGLVTQTYDEHLPNEAKIAMRLGIPVVVCCFDDAVKHKFEYANFNVLAVCEDPQDLPRAIRLLQAWSLQEVSEHDQLLALNAKLPAKRILLADDNLTNIQILAQTLENAGHSVVQANDGEQVLDKFGEGEFDLVILDYNMPRKNGLQATQMIRVLEVGANVKPIPIVIVSADATRETERAAFAAGATMYLAKPIKPTELLEKLTRLFVVPDSPETVDVSTHARKPDQQTPATKSEVLDMETMKQLRSISMDPLFVPSLIEGYIGDGENHIHRIKLALKTNNYEEWKDCVHAFRSASCSLGLIRLQTVLANANMMAKQMFLANGHNMILQIEEEYRLAALALNKLSA